MIKNLLFLLALLFTGAVNAQSVAITANGGTSGNIVLGTLNYHASEYIYTEAEIGATNFLTAGTAIDYVAFNVTTVGAPTTFSNVTIYMQNVPAGTTTFVDGTYNTAAYTQVYSGSFTAAAAGWNGVTLTTPFVRTAGSNLQVLVVRTDNATHSGYVYTSANGNNTSGTLTTSRRYNSSTTAPASGVTTLTASAFRAAIQLKHLTANDIGVTTIRTLGKIAMPSSNPHVISAAVVNDGTATQTNIQVTLNITGANTFTNTQTIATLAPGAVGTVTFANFIPTALGTNTVTVSVPADGFAGNNSSSMTQQVTPNVISTAYSTTPTQGVGFNSATGDLGALIKNGSANTVTQVTTYFNTAGQPYTVSLFSVAGGLPGTSLWTSASQTAAVGANLIAVPNIAVAGDFFVVISQTGTTNFGYAYETENPIRTGTFVFRSPTGTGTWGDFAPNNSFRVMTEVALGSSLPVTLLEFKGERKGVKNLLTWSTAAEQNTKGFDVERSADGKNYSSIGFIGTKAENGNSSTPLYYAFNDERALAGSNFYRLRQTDNDGKITYSFVVVLKGENNFNLSSVYPNPVKENLNLVITSSVADKGTITITDLSGKLVKQMISSFAAGDNNISMDVSALANGTYYIRLVNKAGEVKTTSFIKN